MKLITWRGEERELPGFGMVSHGVEKLLPDHMADSFVEQGLAELTIEIRGGRAVPKKSARTGDEVGKL